ncbi:MAG TPA: hypothetical protein VFV95_04910 [Vicinamibacterales bacterium]|nr:hypothetical protein [Vicinamibacterales bacterium]
MVEASRDSATLRSIRTLLLISLGIGITGTAGELALLGHVESATQWIPLLALALSVPVLLWHVAAPGRASVRALRLLMMAFIAVGIIGVALHYDGNVEFERELHPKDEGMTFLAHVMAGATPVLAPGSMVLLGLVGIAHAYRHPAAARGADSKETVS